MEFKLFLPYNLVLDDGTTVAKTGVTVYELPLYPNQNEENLVLISQFGANPPGVYQWHPSLNRWIFLIDYETICVALFSIATAYICFTAAGATLLPIGDSGDSMVNVYRNGSLYTAFTLDSTGVHLQTPAHANDIFFVGQVSPLKPATLINPGGITDAPNNGQSYLRQSGAWVTMASQTTAFAKSVNSKLPDVNGNVSIAYSDIPGAVVSANPTAQVGPVAVNGSAATFMRSDASPAINLSAAYTWSGQHNFQAATFGVLPVTTATQPALNDSSTKIPPTSWIQAVVQAAVAGVAYNLPAATASTLGGVKQGANVTLAGDGTISVASPYVLPAATSLALGGVKQGANVTIAGDGTISVAAPYSLPVATTTVLGGVKQGANVAIAGDGTISVASPYALPAATTTVLGGVKQGANVAIAGDGTISVASPYVLPVGTSSVLGGVKQGANVAIAGDGTISVAAPYVLTAATASVLGGVKQGANVTIAGDGTISVAAPYTLTPATTTVIGGVKAGANVVVTGDGTISVASPYVLPVATTTVLGGVKQGTNVTIAGDGTLSVATSPVFTSGSTANAPASTFTNNASTGQLAFYPSLSAPTLNQLVQAGDAALISGTDTIDQPFVIGNDQVASGRPQGIRISSNGVETNTFTVHGVATFDGRPIFNNASGATTPWDSGNLPNPLTTTVAASTYLTQASAAATYVTVTSANATYLTQVNALATYAQLTGGVITGSFAFNSASSGAFRGIGIRTNNLQRWNVGTDVTESGSGNNGGDFKFYSYDDTGALLGNAATIVRATRQFQFVITPTVPTATVGDSSTNAASTAFVQKAIVTRPARTVTTSTGTISPTDYYVGVNFAGAVALSIAAGSSFSQGQQVVIKDESGAASTKNVTITANGADRIDGQSSVTLAINYGSLTLLWNTDHWSIV